MKALIDKIKNEAYIIDNRIIKVDHFINHMLDSKLVFDIGKEFAEHFTGVTKILTIETSGIAFALAASFHMDYVPVVFAKKMRGSQSGKNVYVSKVFSYTKQIESLISVDKQFLLKEDKVLIIDDFLATGEASLGLIDIIKQSGAEISGVGIVIEKSYEHGRRKIQELDIDVHSLACVNRIEDNKPIFKDEMGDLNVE
jgi:xanthine phosphoribosyltransferase